MSSFEKRILKLRKAEYSDAEFYYEIYNQSDVKSNSFNHKKITLEEHKRWFFSKLEDKSFDFYVCEMNENEAGVLRIEMEIDNGLEYGIISFSVKSAYQRNGIGTYILEESAKKYKGKKTLLIGKVKKENKASHKSFIKAGYKVRFEDESKVIYEA